MKRIAWLVVAALTPSVLAHADEPTARKHFDAGERAYNLGQFDQAAEWFRKAYEEWAEPAFLFNLAQTYRQMGDCKQASFFYKRFLALKEQDTKKPIKPALKAEVEKRIVELDECIKTEIASKPPNQLDNGKAGPGGTGTGGTGGTGTGGTQTAATGGADGGGDISGDRGDDGGDDGEGDDGEGSAAAAGQTPSMVALRVGLGGGRFAAGPDISTFQFAGALVGGYPLALGPALRLDLGAAVSFMPVPYDTTATGTTPSEHGTATVLGIVANVAPSYRVAPKISIRGDVGVGVQLFTGLGKMNNPFTADGTTATGALSTLLVRAGLSGDFEVSPNVVISVTPVAFTYSPAPDGFASTISSVTTLAFLAGVAYQR